MDNERRDIDFRRFFRQVKRYWWLYAGCLLVFLSAAVVYHAVRMKVFTSHASVMIEDSSIEGAALAQASKSSAALSMLPFGSSSVNNEIQILTSNDVLSNVIRDLGLNFCYIRRDGLHKNLLFPSAPVIAEAQSSMLDTLSQGFRIRMHIDNGRCDIKATTGLLGHKTLAEVSGVRLPYTLKAGPYTVRLSPADGYDKLRNSTIDVIVAGTQALAETYAKNLSIATTEKKSDVIEMHIEDPDQLRGRMILDALIAQYTAKRLDRRRENALNELKYCSDRLDKLFKQLTESEEKVEDFKRANNVTALALDSASWVARTIGSRDKLETSRNELTYYDQVLFTLESDKSGNTFLPSSLDGKEKNPLAEQYNSLIAEKRDLERSATPDNPALKTINEQLRSMRNTLINSFRQNVDLSRRNLGSIYGLSDQARAKMSTIPGLERELFNLMRDKTIKNELYLYLLQRREAAELRLYATDTNSFVIDKAYSDIKPSPFKSLIALIIALVAGLLIPTAWVIFTMRVRNVVRQPMDVAFIDLEGNAVAADKNDPHIRSLRKLLTDHADARIVYTLDLAGDNDTLSLLSESLRNIDISALTVVPAAGDGNDTLMTDAFRGEVSRALETAKYAFVPVPDRENISEIISLIDAADAMLLVILSAGKTRRKSLRRLLRGQRNDRILVYIAR